MGLTHVAMRKLGFLFDFTCGLFYISLFREAQGCNKCSVLRGNVRSSFQVDFAAAAKGGGGREVEEKRGRGSKQGKAAQAPTFQASSGQPESHFAQPCHTLSAVCWHVVAVQVSSLKQPDGGAPGLLLALAPTTTRQALHLLLL